LYSFTPASNNFVAGVEAIASSSAIPSTLGPREIGNN
jgi:hypothetical protein